MPSASAQPNGVPQTKPFQEVVDNVDASRIDGRARQVLYRQQQLRALHNYLIKNKAAVVRALQDDTKRTRLECEFEFAYSVEVLEHHFNRLNFKKSVQTEKRIPEAPPADWREPLGSVAIISGTSTPLSLFVCPLASAIGAGNCAVVVPPKSAAATSKILEDAVSQLDNDSYVAIPDVSVEEIQKVASSAFQGVVLPSASQAFTESSGVRIIRPHGGRSFAIVDRSCANLKYAASRIAQAKFLYGGSSPFSPAFVLVNEWVKPEFMRELFAAISQYFPENIAVSAAEYGNISEIQKRLTSGKANYGRVVMSGYSGSKRGDGYEVGPMILEAERTRGSELVSMTTHAPILPLFSVRSLDDAIDLGNAFSNGQSLALYTFSSPVDAAYLGQFVDSKSVFMNEIPLTLTVGPPFPDSPQHLDPFLRYSTETFSTSKLFAIPPTTPAKAKQANFLEVREFTNLELPERPLGKRIDFFLQGLFTGGGGILTALTGTFALTGYGAWRYFRR